MKAKRIFLLPLLAGIILLAGCSVRIANITPETVPTNPSGIYTLTATAKLDNDAIDMSSVRTFVVIDGEKHLMTPSKLERGLYDYDYDIPEGRDSARFYYLLNYRLKKFAAEPGQLKTVESGVHEFKLIDRYSISLDAERAPIGTQLAVLGRGFTRRDKVYVGGVPAETQFISTYTLQFIVPALPPDRTYPVEVRGGKNIGTAGMLRIDPGIPLRAVPASLELVTGQRQALAFALASPAPEGGLSLNVTTDIPDSIIMPEVMIPAGSRTVSITIEGGDPGSGSLFINASGASELTIPVTVRQAM